MTENFSQHNAQFDTNFPDNPADMDAQLRRDHKPTTWRKYLRSLVLVAVLLLTVTSAFYYAYQGRQPVESETPLVQTEEPTFGATLTPITTTCPDAAWIMVENADIKYYCATDQNKQTLFQGKTEARWYTDVQFINDHTISFQACERDQLMTNNNVPYVCAIMKYDMPSTRLEVMRQFTSYANDSDYQVNGETSNWAWSHDRQKIAYVMPASNTSDINVYIYDITTGTTTHLGNVPSYGGREGGYDDETKILFSPKNDQVVIQDYGWQIVNENGEDLYYAPVLTHVFAVNESSISAKIWQNPYKNSTFTSFLNNDQILYKEFGLQRQPTYRLCQADLTTGQKQCFINAKNWYNISLVGDNQIIFWQLAENNVESQIVRYDYEKQTVLRSWPQLVLLKMVTTELALVGRWDPCQERCMLNDQISVMGLLNINTGELDEYPDITPAVYNLDVYIP